MIVGCYMNYFVYRSATNGHTKSKYCCNEQESQNTASRNKDNHNFHTLVSTKVMSLSLLSFLKSAVDGFLITVPCLMTKIFVFPGVSTW